MEMFRGILEAMLGISIGKSLEDAVSWDYQNDPTYKKNLERLIERNREFEEKRNEPNSELR
jgi:hypothetical protein